MESISNSGVSLILNPDIANAINDHEHQHDLSTCEEEFENQEEIQQMLANAFDSQSLSNTENDEHVFDDEEEEEEEEQHMPFNNPPVIDNHHLFQEENENLRQRLAVSQTNEEIYRKAALDHERETIEINEKYEQNLFSLRLNYETKIEQLTIKTSEQQIEMLTLKQMYETILDEKRHVDQQIHEIRFNEQNLQENLDRIQFEYDQLLLKNQKPIMIQNFTQTDFIDKSQQHIDELKRLQHQSNEREAIHSMEKIQYEKTIEELSKRPLMSSIQLQTDFLLDDERKLKQLQSELEEYKLKLNSKQMELNSLKFDYDNLQQDMNDRLSLLTKPAFNQVTLERDQYFNELNQLKTQIPELKQQMIENFQSKVITFKEQVKKSLVEKENDYRKKIQDIEDEYIGQYEQVLEKNKQVVRSLITAKQEEFQAEKTKIIVEYEEKLKELQKHQLTIDERHIYEQKIQELTRANEKCSQHIAKREKLSLNLHHFDETKRKYNDEIHRLYDQITKQNQQQILLIDEHQKQIEQLKNTYDQRYRILLDEWKSYNNNLHENNTKLKTKLKEYEKTIVQLRYHIINLQIEYLQNGGNANKILPISNEI
ncbi:hypothetical protein I4U23_006555 [Adineta vaga]|nr:hypothetical protein I4U23_006555 [Adineta vaga]